ncbi:MAG: LapA family protein [Gallionellaceae bacterium]|jgi:uncharacterized integral membrane protein|nr:LapA family protein [Gallionellaceae bacterium]
MRYLIWLLRAALFLILLGFAVKNSQPVVLNYFFDYQWNASLVVVLLTFFALGVAIGVLALLGGMMRDRRKISRLERELRLKNRLIDAEDKRDTSVTS